jgi:hypothetical protein
VQQLDDRELVVPEGFLEVLRRQVDEHIAGEVTARAGDRGLEQVTDLGVFGLAGDPADVLVELLVGALATGRVLGKIARALAGQIVDHPAPGLVVVVIPIDGGDSEDRGGQEGQARGEHPNTSCLARATQTSNPPKITISSRKKPAPCGSNTRFSSPLSGGRMVRSPRAGRTSAQSRDHNNERPGRDVKFPRWGATVRAGHWLSGGGGI